ncbi:MAG: hypothetical protein D6770_02260 [Anaerolineae bacterium]|nr:MAG: hypothetical protein D6770_02260 [Anaerolineae bacterium]
MNVWKLASGGQSVLTSLCEEVLAFPYLSLFGHRDYQRFAVIGHARTGSNYLLAGLRTSKHVRVYHEIFAAHNRTIGKDFERILSLLYRKQSKRVHLVGFKLFYNHLTEEEWDKFLAHTEFKIIHLTRWNRLRTIVSLDIAFRTGQWTRSKRFPHKRVDDRRISLDTSTLLDRLDEIRRAEERTRERLKGRPLLEVVYEQLTAHPDDEFRRIGAYLGVNDIDPGKIHLTRQNPESLDRLIINYDEVCQVLKGTEFAEYLDA